MKDYRIIVEWGADNCSAYSPDVPGCVTTGKTREKTRANMLDALDFHIESMIEDGDPIPVPHGRVNGELSPAAQRRLAWLRARRARLASNRDSKRPTARSNGSRSHHAAR